MPVLALALAFAVAGAHAQTIHPTLSGDALLGALAADFAPTSTFGYDRARDSLFAAVELEPGDSLRCAYSGVAVWIDPALDPTTAAWNASPQLSTEHVWPQSHGADLDARSDLHHLRPVQQSVNASRGNVPFGETADADVDKWYGPDGGFHTAPPPLAVRDLYSEKLGGGDAARFEPREGVAGDAARAVFYVYAVYGPPGLGQVDPAFFETQRADLLDWHAQDPPDAAELARTQRIAAWQGTPNPFVLDATLALRAFGEAEPAVAVAALSATATADGTASVAWETAAETGLAAFRVRGRPDVFGAAFELWGEVPAAGAPSPYALAHGPLAPGAYRVALAAVSLGGTELSVGEVGFAVPEPVAAHDAPGALLALALDGPNPTRGALRAMLSLGAPTHVRAEVLDALGRVVRVLHEGPAAERLALSGSTHGLAPGVYVLRVTTARSETRAARFTVAR